MIQHVRQQFTSAIDDTDIVWGMHLWHERSQLEWCLPLLRAQYPRSRVALINDGDGDDYSDVARRFDCDYIHGEHLGRLREGHLFVRRLLGELRRGSESYCFKIDPDTRIWRRFATLPAFSCVFGTLETLTEGCRDEILVPANVQGGCIGMTSDVVDAMLASDGLSEEQCATRCFEGWARCHDTLRVVARDRFCDDFIISWLAHALGVPIVESTEIRSRWRRKIVNPGLRFAITHPHKLPAATSA